MEWLWFSVSMRHGVAHWSGVWATDCKVDMPVLIIFAIDKTESRTEKAKLGVVSLQWLTVLIYTN